VPTSLTACAEHLWPANGGTTCCIHLAHCGDCRGLLRWPCFHRKRLRPSSRNAVAEAVGSRLSKFFVGGVVGAGILVWFRSESWTQAAAHGKKMLGSTRLTPGTLAELNSKSFAAKSA